MPIELRINDVRWSREQGHPILVMDVHGDSSGELIIILSPADAQMLATKAVPSSQERMRLVTLIEGLSAGLNAPLSEVRFRLDAGMVLTADLHFGQGANAASVPANFADAVVLALRAKAPMFISEQDLRWIRAVQEPAPAEVARREPQLRLARSIDSFIESLQLDDLTGPEPAH